MNAWLKVVKDLALNPVINPAKLQKLYNWFLERMTAHQRLQVRKKLYRKIIVIS